jgi:branched-chain amino acid transport system ATP-binding protein
LLELKREGLALLVSEQNLHFARLIADRVVIVEKGRAVFEGALSDFDERADIRDAYLAV